MYTTTVSGKMGSDMGGANNTGQTDPSMREIGY